MTILVAKQWFHWQFATLRHYAQRGSSGKKWISALDGIIAELEGLNRSTECDFLAVGENLMAFLAKARQIETEMAALTELLVGERSRDASVALTRILEYSNGMDARIEQSGHTLVQVRDLSSRIRLAFGDLRNTVSTFRTLCTLTRIETSRIGTNADFGDLAAEVGPLSENIQASGEGVLAASSRLDRGVQEAICSASSLRSRQLKHLPALIAGVVESLQSFEERRQRAAELSASQAAQYRSLCDALYNVVKSIQFHDITRQQVEHVVQTLRQVRGGDLDRTNLNSLSQEAHAILALQSCQLAGAAGTFATSIGRIERDLESMAVRARQMAEAGGKLLGVSADDQNSFFGQMEAHFTAILKMLHTCNTEQSAMESTATGLEGSINQMQDSISQIREIEIHIQRIAMNATIVAVHLGDPGKALNLISEVMQRLAFESNTKTEDVSETLTAMSVVVNRASGASSQTALNGGAHGSRMSEVNDMIDQMQHTVVDLHTFSEASFCRVEQITELGAQLARDIGSVRSGLSVGPLFEATVDRARSGLERLRVDAALETQERPGAAIGQLESLAKQYTTQAERDIHEAATGNSAMAVFVASEELGALPENGNLGDNVELF